MIQALVCDDYEPIVRILTLVLEGLGIEVIAANDGDQALDLILKSPPGLIISDIDMPGPTGICIYKRLRVDTCGLDRIPFILMSPLPPGPSSSI